MTNYNAKAAIFTYYNMLAGPSTYKTESVQPPQFASGAPNASAGMNVLSLLVMCPTTSPQWFYAPSTNCELWLVNNSKKFTVTFVLTNGTVPFYVPLRPTEIMTIPSNTTGITSIQAGNLLNPSENTSLPAPSTTDVIPIDFVVMQ